MANDIRDDLLEIWRELLDNEDIQPDDDFTALGGDSIFAMRLIARVFDQFGLELTPGALFDHGNVGAMAVYVASRLATDPVAI
jgi:acyl carrier protein